jgi:hypothetical protein
LRGKINQNLRIKILGLRKWSVWEKIKYILGNVCKLGEVCKIKNKVPENVNEINLVPPKSCPSIGNNEIKKIKNEFF